ncbi:AMP-binding protein, partial [Akkermansia sp.]
VMAPPHLRDWAEEAAAFLSRRGMDEVTAFATSGSSGSPPKAILFTRRALDVCARGALEHLHAECGDWCCPLPVWHVGGAMIYLRAALAGTDVHALHGRWNPQAYADLMKSSGACWSSLVPTQVVDLVNLRLRAPSTAGCIIVGGGALDMETGRKARALGWPVVQSYGMTESGSQLATAFPGDPYHTDRLSLLPHWEAKTDEDGLLRFQGEGKLCGRLLTQPHGGFLLERVEPQEWWSTRDLVRLEGRLLTFLRRADRLVKVLGELVDPDAVQDALRRRVPEAVVEAVPHPRAGMELVACGPAAVPLERACREWNAAAPGPQRIRAVMETPIPLTVMGKLDRRRLRALLEECPEKLREV